MINRASSDLERFRAKHPAYGWTPRGSLYGYFKVGTPEGATLHVISGGPADPELNAGWEHVSVSVDGHTHCGRLPTWDEMCIVKRLFWKDDELVVQFHPPEKDYINQNQVLHLWKSPDPVSLPPKIQV